MKLHRWTLAVVLAVAAPAWAQDQAAADEAEKKVQVSGVKNPALRPYRIMTRGLDAFDEHHALAPAAKLRFELWNADGSIPNGNGLALRLAGDKVDLALAVDAQATFELPRSADAFDDNADLVLNRKKEQMGWRPRVRSPGVPDNARRMGDMRLECEVAWAVMKDQLSFVKRSALAVAGGMCRAPMTVLHYRAPRPLASVALVSGERSSALKLDGARGTFIVPLRDTSWNDDSLIVYTFADAAPAAPTEQGAAAP